MEWLLKILEGVDKKTELVDAIKKELPKHFKPAAVFNEKNEEAKALKAKLEEANKEIAKVSEKDTTIEKLKKESQEWADKYKTFETETQAKLTNVKKKTAIEKHLRNEKAIPEAIDLLTSQFELDKIILDSKDEIVDWGLHIENIKKTRGSLFSTENVDTGKPADKNENIDNTEISDADYFAKLEVKDWRQ